MNPAHHKVPVDHISELTTGTRIEAHYQGQLVHAGEVTETAAQLGVFWIIDEVNGGRKLLDLTDFDIFKPRTPASAKNPAAA